MNAIQRLAKAAMEQAGPDDVDAAKAVARGKVRADPGLLDVLIDWAVDQLIDAEWRAGRQARWHQSSPDDAVVAFGPSTPSATLMSGMRGAVADARERLMDYEMEPGKRLADCVRADVLRSADRLGKQADTMKMRSAWLKAVAGMLPDGRQTVKTVLREADLQRLHRRVTRRNEAA